MNTYIPNSNWIRPVKYPSKVAGWVVALAVLCSMMATSSRANVEILSPSNGNIYLKGHTIPIGGIVVSNDCQMPESGVGRVYLDDIPLQQTSSGDWENYSAVALSEEGWKFIWATNAHQEEDCIMIAVVTAQVREISFTNNAQMYYNTADNGGWTHDAPINNPLWSSLGTNLPICYAISSPVSMTVMLGVSPDLGTNTIALTLRADGPDTLDASISLTLTTNAVTVGPLTTTGVLSNKVCKVTPTFNWTLSSTTETNSLGSSSHRIYVTLETPIQTNSFGAVNALTEQRIATVITNAYGLDDPAAIATNIMIWRDGWGIIKTNITIPPDARIWLLLDKGWAHGQCAEGATLMEMAMRLLGIQAEYQHVKPSTNLPVRVWSVANPVTEITRLAADGSTEWLLLYFIGGGIPGWNGGDGCCLVNSMLFSTYAGGIVGRSGDVVGTRTAQSAAHSVLLKLAAYNPNLQRWRRADDSQGEVVPVP